MAATSRANKIRSKDQAHVVIKWAAGVDMHVDRSMVTYCFR